MAIALRKPEEIASLREANRIVAGALDLLKSEAKEGMTLRSLDALAEEYILSEGARPSFKGLYGFPNSVCISVNEVVIHGIPTEYRLKEGDIVGFDIGTEFQGYFGDAAITIGIGAITKENEDLIACAKDSLYYAIENIKTEMRFKELSLLLEEFIHSRGFKPLFGFCGHGIGRRPHEEPEIPNYLDGKSPKSGPKIKNGMVFCLEPMICQKENKPIILDNGWDVVSSDKLNASHYEHTVAIIDGKANILSTLQEKMSG